MLAFQENEDCGFLLEILSTEEGIKTLNSYMKKNLKMRTTNNLTDLLF